MDPNKPKLENITLTFTQESNCASEGKEEYETLEVQIESSLGIDYDGGGFFILKTKQWAINDVNDMIETLQRVKDILDTTVKSNPHK